MVILTEKFKFIKDDVFLCPCVDTETGEQWVEIQKLDMETGEVEFGDSINCIHTAITNISVEEYDDYIDDDEFQEDLFEKTLNIRSSEDLEVINLNPEEKFFALKSWAAGIAEAGYESFKLQMEIDNALNLAYPMTNLLLKFMIRVDPKFLKIFLSKIDRECRYNGERHNPSYIANLLKIFQIMEENGDFHYNYDDYDDYDDFYDEEQNDDTEHDFFSIMMEYDAFRSKFVKFRGHIIFIKKEKLSEEIFDSPNSFLHDSFKKQLYTLDLSEEKISNLKISDSSYLTDHKISDINEIKGLQYAVDLERLILIGNNIEEIKNLENLHSLQELYLNDNNISEIKGLDNLYDLKILNLKSNNIREITGLDKLTNLKYLSLYRNQITEIAGLDKLINLEFLAIISNQISEISGLDKLTNLKDLYLNSNQISEINGLDKLTNIKDLYLNSNQISEISGLDNLPNLQNLLLNNNQISEITGLNKLTNLQNLDLNNNKISEITGLDKLTNLQNLSLSRNIISEITGLDKLTNLQNLSLTSNQISEKTGLDKLTNLENFYMGSLQISEIKKYMKTGKISRCLECGFPLNHDEIIMFLNEKDVNCSSCGYLIRYFERGTTGREINMMKQVNKDIEEALESSRILLDDTDEDLLETINEAQEILEKSQELFKKGKGSFQERTGKAIIKADIARAKVFMAIDQAKNRKKRKEYHGDSLYLEEYETMMALENILGRKIPRFDPSVDDPEMYDDLDEFYNSISNPKWGLIFDDFGFGYTSNEGQVIHLKVEKLSYIPENIGNFHNLLLLSLENSNLRTIPESFSFLQKLQLLNLNGSDLMSIPPVLFKLNSIKILWISDTDLIKDIVSHHPKIQERDIKFLQSISDIGEASEYVRDWFVKKKN